MIKNFVNINTIGLNFNSIYSLKSFKTYFPIFNFSYTKYKLHENRSKTYSFFFFLPETFVDRFSKHRESNFYVSKRRFRMKPGYIPLWIYYRIFLRKIMGTRFYRQKQITKLVLKLNTFAQPYFKHNIFKLNTICPANNLYNWKFIV